MSIDWELILSTNLEELNDEKAELLYDQLIEYIPDDENRVDHLQRLFSVCKSVMQVKAIQADVALEELEEMVKNRYDKNELEMMKKELEIYKQSDLSGNDMSQVAFKLSEVNKEVIQLRNNLEHKESETIKYKRRVSEMQNSMEVKDKEIASLRSEVDSLKEDIDGQRQYDERISERQEPLEKLREKNKQIQGLLDDLRDSEAVSVELANQVRQLKLELRNAVNEMSISNNKMLMMEQQMAELNSLNERFAKEKTYLESENDNLRKQLENFKCEEEKISEKFIEKIEKLNEMIQGKDEELLHLRLITHSGRDSLGGHYDIHDQQHRLMEEKDRQIDLLKSQLSETVRDMETQNEIIQRMSHDQDANEKERQIAIFKEQMESLNDRLKAIEVEAQVKDDELNGLRKRIKSYESGEYGLSEAVREVNELSKLVQMKDKKLEESIQQINELKLQLDDAEEEIESFGKKDGTRKTRKKTEIKNKKKESSEKLGRLDEMQEILKLEEENIELKEELRQLKGGKSVRKGEDMDEMKRLTVRVKELEDENRSFHLGLKEVHNSLIHRNESENPFIIECPTLERLCQLLEGRSLSVDLTNVIALKAELDLVRGHNEQLRMEMRRLRNHHLSLIKQYTQDLLEGDSITIKEKEIKQKQQTSEIKVETSKVENVQINEKENEREEIVEKVQLVELNDQWTQTIEFINEDPTFEENKMNEKNESEEKETNEVKETKIELTEREVQTERVDQVALKCKNCEKVTKITSSLKNCIERLQENIKSSEENYIKQIGFLQAENKNLIENYDLKLKEKEDSIRRKEEQIRELDRKAQLDLSVQKYEPTVYRTEAKQLVDTPQPMKVSSSCTSVLETVINCLQARIENKDESIKQYRNMLQEVKQNFENEMIRLIESNQSGGARISDRLDEMIDNEELQSALHNCLAELETSKLELNARISQLESELERKTLENESNMTEIEQLKQKRINPNLNLKREIDTLKEQCLEKENMITNLNKTLKDERHLRQIATSKKPKVVPVDVKRDATQINKDLSDLISENEKLKSTIKEMEVIKWELEKKVKEINEQSKHKMKEKANEISILEKNYEKAKSLVNKNENEIHSLHEKISKMMISKNKILANKSVQCNVANEDVKRNESEQKKLIADKRSMEMNIQETKEKLEKQLEKENELKILLQESLKREKLATIYEEKIDLDKHCEKLLQENAQIKVELRMAEFELRRKAK